MQDVTECIDNTRNHQKVLNHNKTTGEKMLFYVSSQNHNVDSCRKNTENEDVYFHYIQTNTDVFGREKQAQVVQYQNSRLCNNEYYLLLFC